MSDTQITTLFVDIGGVLLTNGWDRHARQLAAETFQLDFVEVNERHRLTFDTYESGKLSLDEYLHRVIFYEERPFSQDEFRAFMFDQSSAYPDMIDLISGIKQRHHLKVASVNNEGRELMIYRLETFSLDRVIDFFISSCFVHFRKPDADIYRVALDIAQVKPEQALYIEDRPMFVQVAQDLGIHGLIHRDATTTRQALAEYGLV